MDTTLSYKESSSDNQSEYDNSNKRGNYVLTRVRRETQSNLDKESGDDWDIKKCL